MQRPHTAACTLCGPLGPTRAQFQSGSLVVWHQQIMKSVDTESANNVGLHILFKLKCRMNLDVPIIKGSILSGLKLEDLAICRYKAQANSVASAPLFCGPLLPTQSPRGYAWHHCPFVLEPPKPLVCGNQGGLEQIRVGRGIRLVGVWGQEGILTGAPHTRS